jgi:hypothetical protein
MRASTSRIIYCIGLFSLTACAVLPVPSISPVAAVSVAAPMKVEVRLAQSIRERIELEATLPARHPGIVNAIATEDALRDLAFAGEGAASRTELIAALADELSAALAERGRVAADAEQQSHVENVISGLIGAINSEVHRNRA